MHMDEEWAKQISDMLSQEVNEFYKRKKVKMDISDYQREALKTAVYPKNARVTYPALGLAGEAGEVADKVKKIIRDKNDTDEMKQNIAAEIGDVLWYCAAIAQDLNMSVLKSKVDKNLDRYASNFAYHKRLSENLISVKNKLKKMGSDNNIQNT